MLSFSDTVRLLLRTSPFSARKLPLRISAASTIRILTLYSWQWLSWPAVRYVRFCMFRTEQVITTFGPVSWRITSSATNLLPLCDNSNISCKQKVNTLKLMRNKPKINRFYCNFDRWHVYAEAFTTAIYDQIYHDILTNPLATPVLEAPPPPATITWRFVSVWSV